MIACIPGFGSNGHGSGSEVLYLFQMEVQPFGDNCQLCHIFFCASGMAAYKIRNDLLFQIQLSVHFIECFLEFIELCE